MTSLNRNCNNLKILIYSDPEVDKSDQCLDQNLRATFSGANLPLGKTIQAANANPEIAEDNSWASGSLERDSLIPSRA